MCVCARTHTHTHTCTHTHSYFTQIFLAQLILVSPTVVPPDFYDPICAHTKDFLGAYLVLGIKFGDFHQKCRILLFWQVLKLVIWSLNQQNDVTTTT